MIRALRHACWAALVCGGCQEILPLADGGVSGGDGGVQADGDIAGDPMLLQPIPQPKPGCPADALAVTASLPAEGPRAYTRRAPVRIEFSAPGAARVEFRSALAGSVDAGESAVEFSFAVASDPIWTGRYPFTVVAFDANGCAANAQVEVPVDGDLLIGTRRGGIWYLGSDGRVLSKVPLNMEDQPKVSALAIRRDSPRILVGFDVDDIREDLPVTEPAIIDLDPTTGDFVPFAIEDIQGEPIYPTSIEPDHLTWGPDGMIWADGGRDGALQVYHPDGRHDRTVEIPESGSASVLGFAAGDRIFATTRNDRELHVLTDDMARPLVRLEDINQQRSIIPGWPTDQGEDTLMVVTWNGNRPTLAQRFTLAGQYVDERHLESFSTQIVLSGDDILARSTTGGIRVYNAAGDGQNLFETRAFLDAIEEDFINLGAMIQLK